LLRGLISSADFHAAVRIDQAQQVFR
jgi:hypothetical protein